VTSPEAAPDPAAPHQVIAVLDDLDEAQSLIEDLEKEGIPPAAISLIDPSRGKGEGSDHRVGATVGRAVLFGLVSGLLIGGLIGLALAAWIDLAVSRPVAVLMGAVFGACVGLAAGGISETRFASPAWRDSQQTEARGPLAVGVHHSDASVVDSAEDVMAAHRPLRLHRQDR
jgi:hypothetical protein